jgi:hypothetical protein
MPPVKDDMKGFILRMQSHAIKQGWMHEKMQKYLMRQSRFMLRTIYAIGGIATILGVIVTGMGEEGARWYGIVSSLLMTIIIVLVKYQASEDISSRISSHTDLMLSYRRFCEDINITLQSAIATDNTNLAPLINWMLQDFRRMEDTARTVQIEPEIEAEWIEEAKRRNIVLIDEIDEFQTIVLKLFDDPANLNGRSPSFSDTKSDGRKSPLVIRIDPKPKHNMTFELDRLSAALQN